MFEVVDKVELDRISPRGCGTGDEVKEVDTWSATVELCLDRLAAAGTCGGKEGTVLVGVAMPPVGVELYVKLFDGPGLLLLLLEEDVLVKRRI